jgi:hypothetical protein
VAHIGYETPMDGGSVDIEASPLHRKGKVKDNNYLPREVVVICPFNSKREKSEDHRDNNA